MKKRYVGLIIIGVFLLSVGLWLYTYQVWVYLAVVPSYPYQRLGLILFAVGAVSAGLGCVGFYVDN